jgi:hypothetical protein
VSEPLECPICGHGAFPPDRLGLFSEDDETTCLCGARLVVNMESDDCQCDESDEDEDGNCPHEDGQVYTAYVTVMEDAPITRGAA